LSANDCEKEVREISKKVDSLQKAVAQSRGQIENAKQEIKAELALLQKQFETTVKSRGDVRIGEL
jgi:peptidoglycan hydrolase CwlO-like protein